MTSIIVAPTILAADLGRLGEEIRAVDAAIAVDDGQNCTRAGEAIAAGASAVIAGSAIVGVRDYAAAMAAIRHGRCPAAEKEDL